MPPVPSAGAKGGGLSRKIGPLPVWAWAAAALVLGYVVYRRFQSSQASSAQTAADTVAGDASDNGLAGAGVTPSGGDSGGATSTPDTSALLDALLQAQANDQANSTQLLNSQLGVIQTQAELVGELGTGAQTLAATAEQQLGTLASAEIGAPSNVAAGAVSAAHTPAPAKTAAKPTSASAAKVTPAASKVTSKPSPVPVGTSAYSAKSKNTSVH